MDPLHPKQARQGHHQSSLEKPTFGAFAQLSTIIGAQNLDKTQSSIFIFLLRIWQGSFLCAHYDLKVNTNENLAQLSWAFLEANVFMLVSQPVECLDYQKPVLKTSPGIMLFSLDSVPCLTWLYRTMPTVADLYEHSRGISVWLLELVLINHYLITQNNVYRTNILIMSNPLNSWENGLSFHY